MLTCFYNGCFRVETTALIVTCLKKMRDYNFLKAVLHDINHRHVISFIILMCPVWLLCSCFIDKLLDGKQARREKTAYLTTRLQDLNLGLGIFKLAIFHYITLTLY